MPASLLSGWTNTRRTQIIHRAKPFTCIQATEETPYFTVFKVSRVCTFFCS